jgi:hypothetical protein
MISVSFLKLFDCNDLGDHLRLILPSRDKTLLLDHVVIDANGLLIDVID